MRIPNKGTPWLVGADGNVRPATQNEVNEIWFRWLQDVDARLQTIPQPTPPAPPPPFSANIQFQDDGIDVGLANPRYVNARANLTATYDAALNRVDLDATGGGSIDWFEQAPTYEFQIGANNAAPNSQTLPAFNTSTSTSGGSISLSTAPYTGISRLVAVQNGAAPPANYGWATATGFTSTYGAFRGNLPNRGGFAFYLLFGLELQTLVAGQGFFVGMFEVATNSIGTVMTAGNPSTATSALLGVGKDTADTNWQFIAKANGGAATKVDTGVAVSNFNWFHLVILCPPNATTALIQLYSANTYGTTPPLLAERTYLDIQLPATTAQLGWAAWAYTPNGTSPAGIGISRGQLRIFNGLQFGSPG